MKALKLFIAGAVIALSFVAVTANACDFSFKITSEEKQAYKVGDEVVVAVTLTLTHRNCTTSADETKFDFTGVKALGATKWKEVSSGVYERKFKLQVTDDPKGKHLLSATRTCNKDGGAGSFSIPVK